MSFDDLVIATEPPPKRVRRTDGTHERHLYEGAVMIAYAMHLLREKGACGVSIHPDGQHNKQFRFADWLNQHGFTKESSIGTTSYGGKYENPDGQTITVNPKSGQGDVLAKLGTILLVAECKGGVINSRHAGQQSHLRRGLYEAVGLLMTKPSKWRQVAVVPGTDTTLRLAKDLAPRCASAGIEIALVGDRGEIRNVQP